MGQFVHPPRRSFIERIKEKDASVRDESISIVGAKLNPKFTEN
jgi:hypothetical protein